MSPIDAHVHIVGNGARGSGCWLRLRGWRRGLAAWMLRSLGLPADPMREDFDECYVELLLRMIRESSLGSVVILAQDEAHDAYGTRLHFGNFHVPNSYVLELARKHPEFVAGVSIHPARIDALAELDRCLDGGARLLKLLPNCLGIDCNDRRYTRFWERMAEARLPLLAHTGGEATVPVLDPALADPRRMTLPLDCGVTVIAAHCATRTGLTDPDWFPIFAEMTQRYPNLYGDNSAFNLPIRGEHSREAVVEPLASRIVYGSDLPVPVSGLWAWLRGFIDWPTYRRWQRCANPLERDYQLKRAVGFPDAAFTRLHALLRPIPHDDARGVSDPVSILNRFHAK
jgi:predicted TIM-barrel fold metal-dependent hydrolase